MLLDIASIAVGVSIGVALGSESAIGKCKPCPKKLDCPPCKKSIPVEAADCASSECVLACDTNACTTDGSIQLNLSLLSEFVSGEYARIANGSIFKKQTLFRQIATNLLPGAIVTSGNNVSLFAPNAAILHATPIGKNETYTSLSKIRFLCTEVHDDATITALMVANLDGSDGVLSVVNNAVACTHMSDAVRVGTVLYFTLTLNNGTLTASASNQKYAQFNLTSKTTRAPPARA